MDILRYRVQFEDEAPRIGSGWRIVTVMIGRKFVHLYDSMAQRTKIKKDVWRDLVRTAIPLPLSKRKKRRRNHA